MRRIAVSFAFLIFASTASFAADMPIKAPPQAAPPVNAFNWTGWYLGIHGGGYWGDTSNDRTLPNVSASDGFFGVQGGYRYQFPNNVVVALQVSAPLWSSDQSKVILPGIINDAKFKGSVLAQGHLGYAFGRFMPFLTGGIGAAWIEGQETIGGVASNTVNVTHTLYTFGAGINFAITDHFTTGVRYNHLWTSHESYACGAFCTPPASIWFDADTFTAVLEYKF